MKKVLGVEEEFFYQILMPSIYQQSISKTSLVIVDCDIVDFDRTISMYLSENSIEHKGKYRTSGGCELILLNGRKLRFVIAKSLDGNMNMRGYRFSSLTYIKGEIYRGD